MAVFNVHFWEVRVEVPYDVWVKCRATEFSDMFLKAVEHSYDAGAWSNTRVMYARFKDEQQATECDGKLRALVEHFENKLKEQGNDG